MVGYLAHYSTARPTHLRRARNPRYNPGMTLPDLLTRAVEARSDLLDPAHTAACRLFNGFLEGRPELAVDCYGRTLVIHNYADPPAAGAQQTATAVERLTALLPWVQAVVVKPRKDPDPTARRGALWPGSAAPDRKVREYGVWYAVDPLLNRDAGLYLDTRLLRRWALAHLHGRRMLNTFAYTGSLGVAAQAGGAAEVLQLDRNRAFLNVAKTSYTLNGFPIAKQAFATADFWPFINQLKRRGELFDCVFIDPPFFAVTAGGAVDLAHNMTRLINKVRPLVRDGGQIVAVNNALYVSGTAYLQQLESLCADGYVAVSALIPVGDDFTGYPHTRVGAPVSDPAPFNHATKIALLTVRRKAVED